MHIHLQQRDTGLFHHIGGIWEVHHWNRETSFHRKDLMIGETMKMKWNTNIRRWTKEILLEHRKRLTRTMWKCHSFIESSRTIDVSITDLNSIKTLKSLSSGIERKKEKWMGLRLKGTGRRNERRSIAEVMLRCPWKCRLTGRIQPVVFIFGRDPPLLTLKIPNESQNQRKGIRYLELMSVLLIDVDDECSMYWGREEHSSLLVRWQFIERLWSPPNHCWSKWLPQL